MIRIISNTIKKVNTIKTMTNKIRTMTNRTIRNRLLHNNSKHMKMNRFRSNNIWESKFLMQDMTRRYSHNSWTWRSQANLLMWTTIHSMNFINMSLNSLQKKQLNNSKLKTKTLISIVKKMRKIKDSKLILLMRKTFSKYSKLVFKPKFNNKHNHKFWQNQLR